MRRCGLRVLMIAAVLLPLVGWSIEPDFSVRSWDNENGLPKGRLTALARTPDGYLWVGSSVGLVRFDGVRFVTLTTNTVPALGDNHVLSLVVDTNGALWIGTRGGTLAVREGGTFRSVPLDPRLRGMAISHLSLDSQGAIWLAGDRGPVRWHAGNFDFPLPTNQPRLGPVSTFISDLGGQPWLLKNNELYSLTNASWRRQLFDFKHDERIYGIIPAGGDRAAWLAVSATNWFTRRGARVFRMEAGRLTQELTPYPWAQDFDSRIHSMVEDGRSRLWVGTRSAGVYCWDLKHHWRRVESREFPQWNDVSTMLVDQDGLIWSLNGDGSLCCIAEQKVASLPLPKPFQNEVISAVCARRNGEVWAGTLNAGVFRLQSDTLVRITNGLDAVQIGTLFEDSRSNLWVGTWGGLYRWDGDTFRLVLGKKDPVWIVLSLCEDRRGSLWVGSDRGIFQISPAGEIRKVEPPAGRTIFTIRAIAEDSRGDIYLSTPNQSSLLSLLRFTGEKLEPVPQNQSCNLSHIHGLCPDQAGGIWITTEGEGLFYLKDGQFRQWTTLYGLPDMVLRSAITDLNGNLWLGSNRGIFGCPRETLEKHQRVQGSPILFWRLSVAEGLHGKLTSGVGQPIASRSTDGRLWFPNQHSLASFDPAEVRYRGRSLPPVIEEVLVDGVSLPRLNKGELRLLSGAHRLVFRYTCPDLRATEQLQFRYRLEGIDKDWVEGGTERMAAYTQVPPGNYRFRVMAGGATGEWWEAEQPILLTVVPRLWERASVRVLTALTLLGAMAATAFGVGRARVRLKLTLSEQQRAVERERQRIAANIHDDLGAGLTRITILSDLAQAGAIAGGIGNQMDQIRTTSFDLTRSMDEIVWAVDPQHDTLDSLATYLGEYAQDFLRAANIRCRLQIPPTLPAIHLSSHVRHNIFLAVKEALNNVVKHAAASEARLQISLESGAYVLLLADNGRGFNPASPVMTPSPGRISGGHGLLNISKRLSEIGGSCEVVSVPGHGTEIRLRVPLSHAR